MQVILHKRVEGESLAYVFPRRGVGGRASKLEHMTKEDFGERMLAAIVAAASNQPVPAQPG